MPRRNGPTFEQWAAEYDRLVAIARQRGVRGVHHYSHRRVPNHVARARVEDLARRLNVPILLVSTIEQQRYAAALPSIDPTNDPLRSLRTGRVETVQANPPPPQITPTVPAAPVWTGGGRRSGRRHPSPEHAAFAAARGPRGEAYTPPPSTPFSAMEPTEFTFGAEFEFLIPRSFNQQRIAEAITAAGIPCNGELYNHFTRSHWKIITDGSITINRVGYVGFEAVSPILQGAEGFRQIEKICDVLVSLGATVNKSCGFHVHIGITPNMNRPEFFKRLVGHYCANEAHIDAIMAPSRRGNSNTYCQPISSIVKDRIDRAETVPQIIAQVPSRFSKVNLQSFWRHKTVEFRHHQGTVEKTKAVSWIKFCMHLVAIATKPEPVEITSNLLTFLCSLKIPAEEVGYFCNRYAHFLSGADNHT